MSTSIIILGLIVASLLAFGLGVSRANARDWTTLPVPARIIPNGVADDGRGPGTGGEHLVWTGRLTPEKGADIAIRAARRAGRAPRRHSGAAGRAVGRSAEGSDRDQ